MLARSTLFSLLAIYGAQRVLAQLKPTTPGPNETYTAGSSCSIAWMPDTSDSWTNVTIDLMSGSNNNMSLVKNVASALDGTNKSLTPYSWTCPDVDPYSTIYFYQASLKHFTNGDDISTRAWTMRFTIASPSNDTEPPENSQQPNGDDIPWGVGHLKDSKSSNTNDESNSDSAQGTFALPSASASVPVSVSVSASASASATSSGGKKPHGHKLGTPGPDSNSESQSASGNDDGGDEGDHDEDANGDSTQDSASKTRSASVAGAKSAAARATAMAHTHDSSSSSNDSSSAESDESGSNNSDAQSTSNSSDSNQAQSSVSGSNSGYKNSGAADAADSANAAGCHCGYENGVGSRLLASAFIYSIVASVLSALVAAYL